MENSLWFPENFNLGLLQEDGFFSRAAGGAERDVFSVTLLGCCCDTFACEYVFSTYMLPNVQNNFKTLQFCR